MSSLVLVDILAALPMNHVVRMARLGHERLRQTCSLKWVTDRMTEVTFRAVVRADQAGGDVAATFCTKSVLKRLKGTIVMNHCDFENADYADACINIIKGVTGKLHMCTNGYNHENIEARRHHDRFEKLLYTLNNVNYVSQKINDLNFSTVTFPFYSCFGLFFEYKYDHIRRTHNACYRPALLNGRHIVDVVRAVCGPADVSEAELDRARREATEGAREAPLRLVLRLKCYEGVWSTIWRRAAITV